MSMCTSVEQQLCHPGRIPDRGQMERRLAAVHVTRLQQHIRHPEQHHGHRDRVLRRRQHSAAHRGGSGRTNGRSERERREGRGGGGNGGNGLGDGVGDDICKGSNLALTMGVWGR